MESQILVISLISFPSSITRTRGSVPETRTSTLLEVTDVNDKGFKLTFSQAKSDDEYVNDYKIVVKEKATDTIVKQSCLWSEYYFYNMPETLSITFDDLDSGKEYTVDIFAGSFWNTLSKPVSTEVTTK